VSADYRRGDQLRALWKLVKALDTPCTVKDICKKTGLNMRRVYRWLDAGVEEGVLIKKEPLEMVVPAIPATFELRRRKE